MKTNVSFWTIWLYSLCVIIILSVSGPLLTACSKRQANVPRTIVRCEIFDKAPQDIKKPALVNYENKINFLGVTLNRASQDQMEIYYYWQVQDDLGKFNTVFVHVLDPEGKMLLQNDHPFCKGAQKGQFVKEGYPLSIPKDAVGKESTINVGLYAHDEPNMPRLNIISEEAANINKAQASVMAERIKL